MNARLSTDKVDKTVMVKSQVKQRRHRMKVAWKGEAIKLGRRTQASMDAAGGSIDGNGQYRVQRREQSPFELLHIVWSPVKSAREGWPTLGQG